MANPEAIAELDAIRAEVAAATDRIFDAIELATSRLQAARGGDARAITAIEADLCSIVEALSFQDITGQRLSRIVDIIGAPTMSEGDFGARGESSLENGPALPGEGLSQHDADALFARLAG